MKDKNTEPVQNGAPMSENGGSKLSKSKKAWLAVGAVFLALVCFLAGWLGREYALDSRARALLWAIDTVEDKYYKEIESNDIYSALYGAVAPDQFSAFYTASEFQEILNESEGTNKNIGIAISDTGKDLQIARVISNSPAELAGIRVGMYLYGYGKDKDSLEEGGYEGLVSFLTENTGEFVLECGYTKAAARCYTVESKEYLASYCMYADSEGTFKFRVEGNGLALTETGGGMAIDKNTGYIRLDQFEGNADKELLVILNMMKERGRKNLVLDLRMNGGGYLTLLQEIASHFIKDATEETPVIATAKYRNGKVDAFRATGNDYYEYFSDSSLITVLADEGTASASECLIGAMVDYGTISYSDIYVRRLDDGTAHSYGKGVMQTTYTSAQGNALRLTAAEIFWPKGKSIHGKGVSEKDGANAVEAPLIPGETDTFLQSVLAQIGAMPD